jgi:23S rRNA (pseudouridine1915-N3)-methyltransferase
VGKTKESHIRAGIELYRKRILAYASVELLALKQEPLRKKVPITSIHKKEAERMAKVLSASRMVIALDSSGEMFTSPELAHYLQRCDSEGRSDITFVIGGPVGLAPEITRKAHLTLSLSPMTLSHELTILVLMEQLYRALAYLHDHPYPK